MSEATLRSIPADAFADERAAHDVLLVEFYTEGCGICASMEPVLSNVARATGVPVRLVNPRDPPGLVERFEITSVPTLALFVDGDEAARLAEGFVGADRLVGFVEDHAPASTLDLGTDAGTESA